MITSFEKCSYRVFAAQHKDLISMSEVGRMDNFLQSEPSLACSFCQFLCCCVFSFSPSSEPEYQVYLNASKVPGFSDDPTELQCRVVDTKRVEAGVRLTVSWYYKMNRRSDDVVSSELLAVMDGDWTLRYGERSKQRAQSGEFIFSKEHTDTFSFRIQRTTEEDRGSYYCVVSAWTRQRNNSWVKSKDVFSKPVNIFWASEGRNFMLVIVGFCFSF